MLDRRLPIDLGAIDVRAVVGGWHGRAGELDAIVKIGECSGVLVRSDLVLTNAHCLEGRVDSVAIAGRSLRVASCAVHPESDPGRGTHDLGFCRLERAADTIPIPIAERVGLHVGAPVAIAGRGRSGPFARDAGVVRIVDTHVRQVSPRLEVGTAERTACQGDSGGAVMIRQDGALRVVAVVRGGTGAICASPAEAVPLAAEGAWLAAAMALEPRAPPASLRRCTGGTIAGALLVVVALVGWHGRRRRPKRTSASRGPAERGRASTRREPRG